LVLLQAVPASAAAGGQSESAKTAAAGNSADHANDNAGANDNAANNPHAQASTDSSADTSAAAATQTQTASTSTATKSSSATTSAGNKNAGCNQTPYGSTGSGANHSGPYNDTCDGSPSLNGNGGGKATGKPCAGCVGKADEKNPKGQYPGGSDHNKGYECDGNNGIGKTNPAHTGCTPPPPPNPPPPPQCVESATVSCGEVEGEVIDRTTSTPSTKVLGTVFTRSAPAVAGGSLPRTGGDVLELTLFGVLLAALGGILTRAARRRTAE
jgi:hypothetical protein